MAEKIGQILIRKGKITPAQLREALRTQQFFGGYLGSHLINLGFIEEPALGETLSEIYRVPFASYEAIRLTRADVIAKIPAAIAQRFRIVPIQLEGNRLHIAMLNPRDAVAINEVSAATGLNVTPWVAPEFRVIQALERHYRLRRESRAPISMKGSAKPAPVQSSPAAAAKGPPVDVPSAPPPDAESSTTKAPGSPVPFAAAESSPAFSGAPGFDPQPPDEEDPGRSRAKSPAPADRPAQTLEEWRASGDDMFEDFPERAPSVVPEQRPHAPRALPDAAPPTGPPRQGGRSDEPARRPAPIPSSQDDTRAGWGLEQLSEAIGAVTSRDDLAREVVAFMARKFRRAAAFAVRQETATGWMGVGAGFDPERLRKISIPLDRPSILSPIQSSPSAYIGPVVPTPESRDLYTFLGGTIPPAVLMVAVTIRERLVTVLYADNGTAPLGPVDLVLWKRVAKMMAMSLEIQILKNKMRRV